MHLSEGVLPWPQAAAYGTLITPSLYLSFRQLRRFQSEANTQKRALFTLGLALIFAVTVIPIPISIAPVMVHMCGTPLVALCLGVMPMILPIAVVLGLQALFFGHGGLSTLGANLLTLGIIGPTVTVLCFALLNRLLVPRLVGVFISVVLGSITIYLADATILSLALAAEKSFTEWLQTLVVALSVGQIPLSLLEATLSVVIVQALNRSRHNLLPVHLQPTLAIGKQ